MKSVPFESFWNFVPRDAFTRYCLIKGHFFVKRDHGPLAEGAVSLHSRAGRSS